MEERRSVSDEEAARLLYDEGGPLKRQNGSRWRRKDLLKSTPVRIVAAITTLVFLFWLFAPVSRLPVVPSTTPKTTSSSPQVDEQDSFDGTPTGVTADINGTCSLSSCLTKRYIFDSVKDFTLRNLVEPTQRGDSFRNSYLRLSPGPENQKADVVVEFSFNSTDSNLARLLDIQNTPKALMILFPTSQPPPETDTSKARAHVETQTRILFRPGLRIEQLTIESTVLGINIPAPIDFLTTTANLTCTAGSLYADPLFNASYAFITMDAGSVAGTFPLFEVLALESDAGTMNIEVIPQMIPKVHHNKHNVPAHLVIQSSAGNVDVQYNIKHGIPERDYTVAVHSDFGRITGSYIHGSFTSLKTSMGEIDATITPMASDRDESELITYTHAGRQQIVVEEPYYDHAVRMARIESSHESKLGSIEVTYPHQWEGTVEAVSKMGSVAVGGSELLRIIREQKSVLGGLVEAEKGQGEGSAVCATERGNVKFSVAV